MVELLPALEFGYRPARGGEEYALYWTVQGAMVAKLMP